MGRREIDVECDSRSALRDADRSGRDTAIAGAVQVGEPYVRIEFDDEVRGSADNVPPQFQLISALTQKYPSQRPDSVRQAVEWFDDVRAALTGQGS